MSKIIQQPVILGKFVGVYGIKGWLKVFSDTDPIANILEYTPWWIHLSGKWQEVQELQGKLHGKGLIVQLKGYDTPEASRVFVGIEIVIERGQLPKLSKGEIYWADLEGMQVVNLEGHSLGHVSQLFSTGSNDVLVVTGKKRHLIPYLPDQVIIEVDIANKLIKVDWDEDF